MDKQHLEKVHAALATVPDLARLDPAEYSVTRLGGLTKANLTGNVAYDPENHALMVDLRAEKVARIASRIPPIEVVGPNEGELLVLGWGSTRGAITAAVSDAQSTGRAISRAHLRYLNPFPRNLGDVLSRFEKVLVPELNAGQLSMLLRAKYLAPVESFTKIAGQPFKVAELRSCIARLLGEKE